jgi:hypothetical protein
MFVKTPLESWELLKRAQEAIKGDVTSGQSDCAGQLVKRVW